jgi:hypothetical protein
MHLSPLRQLLSLSVEAQISVLRTGLRGPFAQRHEKRHPRRGGGDHPGADAGPAGNVIPPDDFVQAVREIADEFDALLIADEILTGFGRTERCGLPTNSD